MKMLFERSRWEVKQKLQHLNILNLIRFYVLIKEKNTYYNSKNVTIKFDHRILKKFRTSEEIEKIWSKNKSKTK